MLCQAPRNYVLIPRARMQMQRRDIAEADVATVLEIPGQSEKVRPGRCVYQSRLTLGDPPRVYVLRVFVDIAGLRCRGKCYLAGDSGCFPSGSSTNANGI